MGDMSGCLATDIMCYCFCCCLNRVFGSSGLNCETKVKKQHLKVFTLCCLGTMSFIKPKKEGMAWEEWCEERERRREVRDRRREEVDETEETKVLLVFSVLTVGVSVPI